ncbi:MAG: type I 3-dehydroquinate dehydratase [Lachnospiraceae bacterium]|nr:type I 3-dehydroquinate dehydratase [Lachnospiraceae bacterium]
MITIRDLVIGEGKPKICVTVTGKDENSIISEAHRAFLSAAEIIEWRADYFEGVQDDVMLIRMLKTIRMNIGSKAFLFTYRTKEEGGTIPFRDTEYMHILKIAIDSRLIDLIDIECCVSEYMAMEMIAYARQKNIYMIGSNHTAGFSLSIGEMEYRVRYMQKLGVDIARLTVIPQRKRDAYRLLLTTHDLAEDLNFPIAVLGLGEYGKYTRVLGELFGSCLTCAVLDAGDDPSEISVSRMASLLDNLHDM